MLKKSHSLTPWGTPSDVSRRSFWWQKHNEAGPRLREGKPMGTISALSVAPLRGGEGGGVRWASLRGSADAHRNSNNRRATGVWCWVVSGGL